MKWIINMHTITKIDVNEGAILLFLSARDYCYEIIIVIISC